MIARLLGRSLVWVVNRVGAGNLVVLSLLFGVLLCLIYGLAAILPDIDTALLQLMAVLALPAAWWTARSRLSTPLAWTLLAGGGLLIVLSLVGRLGDEFWALVLEINDLTLALRLWFPGRPAPDFQPALHSGQEVFDGLRVLLGRAAGWLADLLRGEPTFDPAAAAIVWCLSIWLVSAWAAWAMRRLGQPLLAVLPAAGLLAVSLALVNASYGWLVPLLTLSLALYAWESYRRREGSWEARQVDFSEEVRIDVAAAALFVIAALTAGAAFAPRLSLRNINDFVRRITGPAESHRSEVPEALGMQAPVRRSEERPRSPGSPAAQQSSGVIEALAVGGLPRQHLLGSGPELSERVVMRVSTGELPPGVDPARTPVEPVRYYWRAVTYDRYTGKGWTTSRLQARSHAAGEMTYPAQPSGARRLTQRVTAVQDLGGLLYAAGEPLSANQPLRLYWRRPPPSGSWNGDLFGAAVEGGEYQVHSLLPAVDSERLRQAGSAYPEWVLQRFLSLPRDLPGRVRALAIDLTAAGATPYDRAKAIETYLRTYPYTLDTGVPPEDRDLVDYFLFDLREGYCDYYASAMVVLARAAGIPARLAVGYATGTYDPSSASYLVTEAEAHSWPELFFPGAGWVPFEPTPARPVFEHTQGEPERPLPENRPPSPLPAWLGEVDWRRLIARSAALLLALAGLLLAWALSEPWRLRRLSPARAAAAAYLRLRRQATGLAVPAPAGTTPLELAAHIAGRLEALAEGRWSAYLRQGRAEVHTIAGIYARSLYGPRRLETAEGREAVQAWTRLRWRLWLAALLERLKRRHGAAVKQPKVEDRSAGVD